MITNSLDHRILRYGNDQHSTRKHTLEYIQRSLHLEPPRIHLKSEEKSLEPSGVRERRQGESFRAESSWGQILKRKCGQRSRKSNSHTHEMLAAPMFWSLWAVPGVHPDRTECPARRRGCWFFPVRASLIGESSREADYATSRYAPLV